MRKSKFIGLVLSAIIASELHAQNPVATTGTFALEHATIVTVTKGIIENGTVLIDSGRIAAAGEQVVIPSRAEVIDCSGLYIYPGMIDSGTILGLSEIDSDPRTRDFDEVGDVLPQVKALTAVNPNSALIPVTRVNGVTTVLAAPRGGLFPGTAALVNLHGYTPDQMYAGFQGVVLEFPSSGKQSAMDTRTDELIKKEYEKTMTRLNETWAKALAYARIDSATHGHADYYPEMEALLPVIRGDMPLLVEANRAEDILAALDWVEKNKVPHVVLTGVAEGWRVADRIAKAGIPVITGPVLALPSRSYDRYDKSYANAGLMHKAGVTVAIRTADAENVRNLPYNAGFAANYGLGKDEALRAVTIIPAKIFGVDMDLGSIEPGKIANLFVTDGDPFETRTQVKYLFIHGWKIPLVSRQTELYDEFLHRAPGLTLEK